MPQIAGPQCYVEIFPFEGGNVAIDGRSIISCAVHKNLREDVGTFEITLPPLPGPIPGKAITWTEAITPMSMTLIAMTRGDKKEIIMVGVVLNCCESQKWDSEHGVLREITISGQDLAYYFTVDNWAALTLQMPTAAAAFPQLLTRANLHANPANVAKTWYNEVMAGDHGVNAHTIFPLSLPNDDGSRIFINFTDAMAQLFEDYPTVAVIPMGDFFFASEGNWFGKFRRLLTFPVYEFFVMSAPSGASQEFQSEPAARNPGDGTDGKSVIFPEATGGFTFTMNQLAGVGSTPYVIGRINPVPAVFVANGTVISGLDLDRWGALPLRWPETGSQSVPGGSFIQSLTNFGVDEAKNFYIFNSQALTQMSGDLNDKLAPNILRGPAGSWADVASIHRYGFKPFYFNTSWYYDGFGKFAQDTPIDFNGVMGDIMGRVFSYFHPTPLMLRATVTYPLRPDIFPSMRFRYAPFKDQIPWEFYVEGVDHQFIFGGNSTTTLSLSRGLPVSVYSDTSLLIGIITGDAERVVGAYQRGVPPSTGEPLKAVPIASPELNAFIDEIGEVQKKAQGK